MKIITADYVLPICSEPIFRGAIAIESSTIHAVGSLSDLRLKYPSAPEESHPGHVLMPGLVNAHVQPDLHHFAPPSIPECTAEGELCLHTHWQKHALQYANETRLDLIANAVEESLDQLRKLGITCSGLSSNYEGCASMLERSGLRGVVFPQVFASTSSDMTQERFENALALLEKYLDRSPRVRVGAGPVAPYMISKQLLILLASHAEQYSMPVQLRAAESFEEVEFFFNASGPIGSDIFPLLGWGDTLPPAFQKTPIQYLKDIGLLSTKPSIVGCLHLRNTDYDALATTNTSAIYTPRAIHAFNLGEFPYGKLQESSVTMGLGSKPGLTACDHDLWEEMRCAFKVSGITASELLTMATLGSAQALGWADQIGSLEAGKGADYLLVQTPDHSTIDDLSDAIISNTTQDSITQVVIEGQPLE